jgi:hypothetical protein
MLDVMSNLISKPFLCDGPITSLKKKIVSKFWMVLDDISFKNSPLLIYRSYMQPLHLTHLCNLK